MKRKIEHVSAQETQRPFVKVFQIKQNTFGGGAEDCEHTPETLSDKFRRVVIVKTKEVPSYIN